ncbi:MAG: sugar ABC transporter ATP-binding protein [Planctomycetota bacterium]|jgi:ribose transport system ATP-binding protein|nr:sugar ABC transporter ATP-binding protein [Planctomycetota bacterium]
MSDYIVEMSHINKSFPGVKALDDVSFNLRAGEVMALLGENGAGKSTLMKILDGVYTRDSGSIRIFGRDIQEMTPKSAQENGVAMIHQELNMCTQLSVAENIYLGREVARGGVLSNREMRRGAREILSRLNLNLDPDTVVGSIPVSKQQMVEIAKALSANARILIMDEPTSALTAKEIDELFAIIRKLRSEGCGIVYISHRLEELQHIVDRVTIMRDGKFITSCDFADMPMDEIISNMVGREIKEKFPHVDAVKGKKIFEVKNLNAGRMVRNVSFEVYEGEILGIAGLMGAGRTETTRAIFGVDRKESGGILLNGNPVRIESPSDAIRAGIVLAPEDRKKDGLCTKLSIRENIALPNLDLLCGVTGAVKKGMERSMVQRAVESLRIKLSSPESDAGNLSGGNQQKVVVGKWLARTSRVVIFDEPTRGIDVAAKVEIYNLMNELKSRGIGVVFVSSEMPEILGMSDRIVVMCDGRITGEFLSKDATQEKVLEAAMRFENKSERREAALNN